MQNLGGKQSVLWGIGKQSIQTKKKVFGGFYGDRSGLALSIIVSHISWKKLIRRQNPFLFKSLLFHTNTHTRKDTFAHVSNQGYKTPKYLFSTQLYFFSYDTHRKIIAEEKTKKQKRKRRYCSQLTERSWIKNFPDTLFPN